MKCQDKASENRSRINPRASSHRHVVFLGHGDLEVESAVPVETLVRLDCENEFGKDVRVPKIDRTGFWKVLFHILDFPN